MSYDANSIQTLNFKDAIRTRISMYMGSADNQGVLQCIREIITNCIDEATVGYCSRIFVDLYEGNRVTVLDNGRGCPFGARDDGIDALEAIYTLPHSGGKFNDKTYQNVAGMNGIGAKGVALSSDKFRAVSMRDGKQCELILEKGKKVSLKTTEGEGRGTFVDFTPSPEVYNLELISIKFSDIKEMCRNWSYLYPSLTFTLNNHIKGEEETVEYHAKNGLLDFMTTYAGKSLNKTPLHIILAEDGIEAEIVMCWTNNRNEEFYVFTNGLENVNGGTSLTGVKTALTNYFKKKVKGDVSPDVLRKGLFYAVSCKVPNPSFSDQTKTKVNTPALRGLCQRATSQMLGDFEKKHTDEFQKILDLLLKEVKAEAAAEKARQAILNHEKEQKANEHKKLLNIDKLRDARKLGKDSILLCVEGNSAGGSMSIGRDPNTYGVLMFRGKALNLLKASIEDGLNNEEVKLLLQAMGVTYGRPYNADKLRYGKVALAVDSDFDGSHISLLLMAMLQVLVPDFIKENRLFWLRAPTCKVETKQKTYYYYNEEEFKSHPQGNITFFKGLGQMTDEDLKNSMFSEEWQHLEPIEYSEDGISILYSLMGEDVEPRKEFVFNNIDFSKFEVE